MLVRPRTASGVIRPASGSTTGGRASAKRLPPTRRTRGPGRAHRGWRNPAGKGEHDRRTNRPDRQCHTGTDLYRVAAPAAVGRIAVGRTLLCPARDYGRDGRVFRCNGTARGVRIVTWAISRNPLRLGALVTAGDVCHLHPDRAAAERCGALMGGAPDLVRLRTTRRGFTGCCGPFRTWPGASYGNRRPRRHRHQRSAPAPLGAGRRTSA